MSNFEKLGLIAPLLKAIKDRKYETPSPIQEKAIPIILQGHDVLGSAETGTGKTAAFAIPIIQRIVESPNFRTKKPSIQALIVTPTRELASQIDDNIKAYCKYTKLRHVVVFGGVKQHSQVDKLSRGVHIMTATPGRLLDLYDQGIFALSGIETLVLDEADRMLDMGFIHDIKRIIRAVPKQRQTLFFSATMPKNIVTLSKEILTEPKVISVAKTSAPAAGIDQYIYYSNKKTKVNLLAHLLKDEKMDQVLIFCRTKHGCDRLARDLRKKEVPTAVIHGDRSQKQRQNSLERFKTNSVRVLIATDIAARGIDIKQLKHVINFNMPNVAETYIHRIGRSGRAGETGTAISLVEPEENVFVKDVEKLIGRKITVIKDHPFPQTEKPMTKSERAEFEKEKQRRRQEFFKNRKKKREGQGSGGGKGRHGGGGGKKRKSGNKKQRR